MRNQFLENNRGRRLRSNLVKIRIGSNGQVTITIPRFLALSQGYGKGDIIEFEKESNKLIIKKYSPGKRAPNYIKMKEMLIP